MSLDLKPVQVRLPEDVYDVLKMIADANDHDLGEEARELLIETIMGRGHTLRVAFARLSRAVKTDNMRQRAVTEAYLDRQEKEHD